VQHNTCGSLQRSCSLASPQTTYCTFFKYFPFPPRERLHASQASATRNDGAVHDHRDKPELHYSV
jgi:hypothetical protein